MADQGIETRGFWPGLLTGVLVSGAGLIAIALVYPPVPAVPPSIDAGAVSGPAAPAAPAIASEAPRLAAPSAPAAPSALAGDQSVRSDPPPSLSLPAPPAAPADLQDAP